MVGFPNIFTGNTQQKHTTDPLTHAHPNSAIGQKHTDLNWLLRAEENAVNPKILREKALLHFHTFPSL